MNYKLNRRRFISSTGTVFLLPLFESLLNPLQALAAPGDPRRYVSIYFPDGTYNRRDRQIWYQSTGALGANNMGEVLSPFSANASDFSVYKNVTTRAADELTGQIGQHPAEAIAFLTQTANQNPTISFDQIMGQRTGKQVYVLHGNPADLGPQAGDNGISYLNGQQIRGLSNPGDMYRDLLGKVVPSTVTPTNPTTPTPPVTNSGGSIIDSSLQDLNALKMSLGRSDQRGLDQYLTGLRALETKLGNATSGGGGTREPANTGTASCKSPTNNPNVDRTNASSDGNLFLERFKTFNDLISIAFACDISRTVTIMLYPESAGLTFPSAPSNLRFNGVDIEGWFNHNISHFGHVINNGGGDYAHESSDGIPRCITRDRYFFSIVVDLINKLKAAKDPSGSTILDNTIIHAQYGVRDGMHFASNTTFAPLVVAGGRNFLSKSGQSLDFTSYDSADLMYTFNTILGLGLTSFGSSSRLMSL